MAAVLSAIIGFLYFFIVLSSSYFDFVKSRFSGCDFYVSFWIYCLAYSGLFDFNINCQKISRCRQIGLVVVCSAYSDLRHSSRHWSID